MFHLIAAAGQQGQRRLGSAAPIATGSIDALVTRLSGTSGTTLVSSGFPLTAANALMPGHLGYLRVFVDNIEQAIYVEALEGRHPNGAVRSVLVQFNYDVSAGSPVAAELRLGEPRVTTDIAKTEIEAIPALVDFPAAPHARRDNLQDQGYALAILFPSDPAHLLATDIFEPMISVTDANALGGVYEDVESEALEYADMYWQIWALTVDPMPGGSGDYDSVVIETTTYYERAKFWAQYLFRSADPEFYRMACSTAFAGINLYYEPNGYVLQEFRESPDMMPVHYWLTGDPRSLAGVLALAENDWAIYGGHAFYGDKNGPDPRICARVFDAAVNAHRLGFTNANWDTRAGSLLDKILGVGMTDPLLRTSGISTGAWAPALCNGEGVDDVETPEDEGPTADVVFNFMNGMMCRSLRCYYRWIDADSRIPAAIKGYYDYVLDDQVVEESVGQSTTLRYISLACWTEGTGGPGGVELNCFHTSNLAWLAKQLGVGGTGAPYLALGELLFETTRRFPKDGSNGPLHNDVVSVQFYKQYNETFHDLWPFLSYRLG